LVVMMEGRRTADEEVIGDGGEVHIRNRIIKIIRRLFAI
jgi:hypothetical protein